MITMNRELFQQQAISGDRPVLVEYWAPWCVYCRRIEPALPRVAREYADRLTVARINIDQEPELARQERIEVVPTFVLYHKGDVLGSIVAPDSRARIAEFLEENLGL